jgi:orotate phosphoribosyltransferase
MRSSRLSSVEKRRVYTRRRTQGIAGARSIRARILAPDRAGARRIIGAPAARHEPALNDFRQEFLAFAVARDVLRFGEFVTKAGRRTPYFFNAGLFNDGESLRRLGGFYADAMLASGVACDQLFGPAYKGITLAAAVAIALAEKGHNLPFSFNRKEAKDHGEGGNIVGAALRGRILIVDDVMTAGTSVRESVETIRAHGARPAGVLIALDRMERGQGERSAVDEVREAYGIPVIAIATLDDVMTFIAGQPAWTAHRTAVEAYRAEYGVT